ncbi:MAG: hypothetical protein K6F56_09030 [Oscillospiraceae bacterium]|nr:hypothetical protein [Oscillospiraceae bacterium]
MRSRFIKVFLFTLALSLLALSCCALACADGASVTAPEGCGSFDVQGDGVSATADGKGFRTWLKVEDGTPVQLAQGSQLLAEQSYGTDEIRVCLSASTDFGGKAAVIRYTIQNLSDAERMVRVGSCGNTALGSDAAAAVSRTGGGFVSEGGGLSVLIFPGDYLFDGSWCGEVGANDSKLTYLDQDCDVSWYWFMKLQPGQTASRSVVIAAGHVQRSSVFLDPNGGQTYKYEAASRQERLAIQGCGYRLPPPPFVRGGSRLLGWSPDQNAAVPDYPDGTVIPAEELSGGMTLYAVWEEKAVQTITAEDHALAFGDSEELPADSSDGRISFEVKSGSDVIAIDRSSGLISTKKVGEAVVTVTAAATNDSNGAEKDVTVTVLPKQLAPEMITLTPERFLFSGETQSPALSVKNGERPMRRGTDYEIDASSQLTGDALGEYRVTISGLGNYSGSASAVWEIAKEAPAAELSAYSAVYDGSAHPLVSVTTLTGGTLQYSLQQDGPYSGEIPEAADAGTYTVWYRIAGDERWLDAGPFSCTAEIARRPVAVSGITAADKVYDGSMQAALAYDRAVIDGICGGDELRVRSASGLFGDADVGVNKRVSISAITLEGAHAGNYELNTLPQQSETSADITARQITIRAKDQKPALYERIVQSPEQVSCSGLSSFDQLKSVQLSTPSTLGADGTGRIMPGRAVIVRRDSTQETTKNYKISYVSGTLRAEQRELTLSWTDTEFVYDGKAHVPKATVIGTQYGEVLAVQVTGAKVAATPEGEEYIATATGLRGTNAAFYKLPEAATQTFRITPRSLEADEISVEYRPGDDPSVIGPVPADGKAYGFRTVTVYDGTRRLTKNVDYTLESNYSTIYGPHTLRIIGKGNYKDSLSRDWTLVGDGVLTASVEVKNGGAAVYWNNASEQLAYKLLDESDLEMREEYGTPADVFLQIRPAVVSSGVSAKAGQLGETVGANYDLSLVKRIGNASTIIHNTEGIPISVTIDIPEELRKAPLGYYRSFTLIHLNNGSAEVVASGTGSSFTFTTTSFSAYAISYRDVKLPPSFSPPTGDTARLPLWSASLLLSAAALLLLARRRRTI